MSTEPKLTLQEKLLKAYDEANYVQTEFPEPVVKETATGTLEFIPINTREDFEAYVEGLGDDPQVMGFKAAVEYAKGRETAYRLFSIELDGHAVGAVNTTIAFEYRSGWCPSREHDAAYDDAIVLVDELCADTETLLELDA